MQRVREIAMRFRWVRLYKSGRGVFGVLLFTFRIAVYGGWHVLVNAVKGVFNM